MTEVATQAPALTAEQVAEAKAAILLLNSTILLM
jgi:hypothetical protein